jgi:hypothetical protein
MRVTSELHVTLDGVGAKLNRAGLQSKGDSRNQSPEGANMALAYSEANCWLSGYLSLN